MLAPIVSEDRRPSGLLGLLIVVCVACAFLMVPILEAVRGPFPSTFGFSLLLSVMGCVLAQGCLLAAWVAWSEQPFWQRLTRHWVVAAILYLIWAAGLASRVPSEFAEVSSVIGLTVPLVSIGAQTPLWIARQFFGWRLVRGEENHDIGSAPLAIRDLMMATVVVAVSLALARLAPALDNGERAVPWIIMFGVASAVSTIALLPASAMLLRTRQFQRGVLFAGLYAAFWMGLLWLVVLIARYRGFGVPPLFFVVGISCLILSFAATVILAAAVARERGYRLVTGRIRRRGRLSAATSGGEVPDLPVV